MTLLTKVPLSLVRATVSGLSLTDSGAPAANMATTTRQNVTWVEVRTLNNNVFLLCV